jgi:hypothetical protein
MQKRTLPVSQGDALQIQVELVGRLMGALASRGAEAARQPEAAALLSQALGSAALLSAGDVAVYHGCLRGVLARCGGLAPSAVASLLVCFDLGGFCAAVLLPRGSAGGGRMVLSSSLQCCMPATLARVSPCISVNGKMVCLHGCSR